MAAIAEETGRTIDAVKSAVYRSGAGSRARRDRHNRGNRWRSYTLAIRRRAEGVPWSRILYEAQKVHGYPASLGSLKSGTRAYRRALLRKTS